MEDVITPASPLFPERNFFCYKTEKNLDKEKFQKFPLTMPIKIAFPNGDRGLPQWLSGKESTCNAGDNARDVSLILR